MKITSQAIYSKSKLQLSGTGVDRYIKGVVATKYGFVNVYCDRYGWSLDFIWQGRQYSTGEFLGKSNTELLSERALTLRSGKLAKAVVEGDL